MVLCARAPQGVACKAANLVRCILASYLPATASSGSSRPEATATPAAATPSVGAERVMLTFFVGAAPTTHVHQHRYHQCLPRAAARHLSSSSKNVSNNSSTSSGNSSSNHWQPPFGRRSRSRDYDPPLRAEFAASERRERMLRSPATTGGWSPSWTPYKPPDRAAAGAAPTAAAGPRSDQEMRSPCVGYTVPYRFRVEDALSPEEKKAQKLPPLNRPASGFLTYTDFSGNRLPTLDTAENVRYWQDDGLDRLLPRVFPIHLPPHRRIDPLFRELIFSLAQMDPRRFNVSALAMRYGLATESTRRISRAEAVMKMKEIVFKQKLGYDQMGTEEIDSQEENKFEGWKSTFDWVMKQHIEVETLSAFPLPARRDPVPKRVDVDVTVHNTANLKVISWIDPNEKVVF
ncbi:hypothetical protein, conserved [Eimeria maxima]|uniref:Uncharacterized protein n=1 Tax=Eimeria maxima TaxID=5804 RepID=U6M9T5_EIMMA|nr:hypothetical protein, conserved [Eimeria maxima]CDJ59244.1 hypothetical protein, conserved [Eimeria maxima]